MSVTHNCTRLEADQLRAIAVLALVFTNNQSKEINPDAVVVLHKLFCAVLFMGKYRNDLLPLAADLAFTLGPYLEPRQELFYSFANKDLASSKQLDNLCYFVLKLAKNNAKRRHSDEKSCEEGLVALAWSKMLARSDCDARLRNLVVEWIQEI